MITRVCLHRSEIWTISVEYEYGWFALLCLCVSWPKRASPGRFSQAFAHNLTRNSIAWGCPGARAFPAVPPCDLSPAVPLQIGILGPPGQQAPPPYPGQSPASQPVMQQPSTPMFVSPPPKTQRLLHSEAYLKYIEGLSAESNSISKWDQTLAGKALGSS